MLDVAEKAMERYLALQEAGSHRALEKWHRAQEIVTILHSSTVEFGSGEWMYRFSELRGLVPAGIYELHKSTPTAPKHYVVLGVGDHSEDKKQFLVACSALYPPHVGGLLYRPLLGEGGFLQPVWVEGSLIGDGLWKPRFKFVRPLTMDMQKFLAEA